MSLNKDLERILDVIKCTDPSFAAVDPQRIDGRIEEVKEAASQNAKERFLLTAMRLLALPANGHTRLIPNGAVSVLPLRFVTIGRSVFLTKTLKPLVGIATSKLITVNGADVEKIERAAGSLLAGTPQRKRVIGPILFAWPAALAYLGFASAHGETQYQLQTAEGETTILPVANEGTVLSSELYPRSEHGQAEPVWNRNGFVEIHDHAPNGFVLKLPSFFDPEQCELPKAINKAAEWVRSQQHSFFMIDVRGNTGGNFLATMPLIDAISESAQRRRCAVLVDKFTFSAAIVFVAILKYRLGRKLKIVGEDMGDGLKFYAEGGLIVLPSSGAVVRYSSALHDWETGTVDQTTPPEIAREIVPVHKLEIDRDWTASPFNMAPENTVYEGLLKELARM